MSFSKIATGTGTDQGTGEELYSAFTKINGNVDALVSALAAKAAAVHTHTASQITDLSTALETLLAASPVIKTIWLRLDALEAGTGTPPVTQGRVLVANLSETSMSASIPATGTTKTIRMAFVLHQDTSDLEFVFRNGKLNADGTTTGAVPIAGIAVNFKKANGSLQPANFDGNREVSLALGEKRSAIATGSFTKGRYILVVRLRNASAGGGWPGSWAVAPGWNGLGAYEGDALDNDSGDFSAATYLFTPAAILGTPTGNAKKSIAILGDSIATGFQDSDGNADDNSNRGAISKGLSAAGVPTLRITTPGLALYSMTDAAKALISDSLSIAHPDYILDELSVNDLVNDSAARDLAVMKSRKIAHWDWLASLGYTGRVIVTTTTPVTTDNEGTTPESYEAVRVALNNWVRTMPHAAIVGVWDYADQLETARNSGIWKSGYTGDRIHPGTQATADTAPYFTARGADLLAGKTNPDGSSGGGDEVEVPVEVGRGWNPSTLTASIALSGDNNRTFTIQAPSGNVTAQGLYAVASIAAGEKRVFAVSPNGGTIGEDLNFGLGGSTNTFGGYFDAYTPAFSYSFGQAKAAVNGAQALIWQGIETDQSKVAVCVDRSTSGTVKLWVLVKGETYNYGNRGNGYNGADPATGTLPLTLTFDDATPLSLFGGNFWNPTGTSYGLTLLETHADFKDVLPTLPSGFKSLGDTGETTTGTVDPNDPTGGVSQTVILFRGYPAAQQTRSGSITPMRAFDLKYGFNLHNDEVDNGSWQSATIANLNAAGARLVRLPIRHADDVAFAKALIAGVPGLKIAAHFGYNDGTPEAFISALELLGVENIELISQTNEWNARGESGKASLTFEFGKALKTLLRAHSTLSGVPVMSPSETDIGASREIAGLKGYVDGSELHSYSSARPTSGTGWGVGETNDGRTLSYGNLEWLMTYAGKAVSGNDVYFAGETGWSSDNEGENGGTGLDGQVALLDDGVRSRYMVQNVIKHFRRRFKWLTFYSLNDKWNRGDAAAERHFGSFNWTGSGYTPKGEVAPMKRLMDAIKDGAANAASVVPPTVNLSVSGDTSIYTPDGLPWGYGVEDGVETLWLYNAERGTIILAAYIACATASYEKVGGKGPNVWQTYERPAERTLTIGASGNTVSGLRYCAPFEADGWQTDSAKASLASNQVSFTISDEVRLIEFAVA